MHLMYVAACEVENRFPAMSEVWPEVAISPIHPSSGYVERLGAEVEIDRSLAQTETGPAQQDRLRRVAANMALVSTIRQKTMAPSSQACSGNPTPLMPHYHTAPPRIELAEPVEATFPWVATFGTTAQPITEYTPFEHVMQQLQALQARGPEIQAGIDVVAIARVAISAAQALAGAERVSAALDTATKAIGHIGHRARRQLIDARTIIWDADREWMVSRRNLGVRQEFLIPEEGRGIDEHGAVVARPERQAIQATGQAAAMEYLSGVVGAGVGTVDIDLSAALRRRAQQAAEQVSPRPLVELSEFVGPLLAADRVNGHVEYSLPGGTNTTISVSA